LWSSSNTLDELSIARRTNYSREGSSTREHAGIFRIARAGALQNPSQKILRRM
jgi:hypothetical protein